MSEIRVDNLTSEDAVNPVGFSSGLYVGPSTGIGATITFDGNITATSFSGSGANITGIPTTGDINTLNANIAVLGFKIAVNGSLAKYNLVDQVIDDFQDTSGIDASASTNEVRNTAGKYYSGITYIAGNYFGDASDGAFSSSGNVTHTVQNKSGSYDGDMVVKQYSSFTLNAGHTMTTDQPCRGMMILVTGNATISGTLSMKAKGAFANPENAGGSDNNAVNANGLQFGMITSGGSSSHTNNAASLNGCGTAARTVFDNQPNAVSNGTVYTIVRKGANGGAQTSATSGSGNGDGFAGNNGSNGGTGQSGGGGGGSCMREVNGIVAGGAGSYGSCFSGGSAGAGAANATNHNHTGGAGTAWGGRGGDVDSGQPGYVTGSGVGNPAGTRIGGSTQQDGNGGLIVLLVGGNLTVNSGGTITARGVKANDESFPWQGACGGSSGGGNLLLLRAGSYTNNGTVSANGGAAAVAVSSNYTNRAGGEGGHGSVQTGQITVAQQASPANLVLQSVANTASAEPDKADLVLMIENSTGTATLNTDIKGSVSRDGGSTWSQGTLVDEGTWGTNKKIVAFHNLDISGQPSGTSMKYKIETLNQGGSLVTRIYGASLGWK